MNLIGGIIINIQYNVIDIISKTITEVDLKEQINKKLFKIIEMLELKG